MKIAIIGGGFTGLAAAIELNEKGHEVTIFEANEKLGGLASGFLPKSWKWPLEIFYHHIFTNDKEIINMAKSVGWPPMIMSPITTSFIDGKEIQLDSPISLLKFKKIDIFSRVWMGAGLAILKIISNGLFLEKFRVVDVLPKLIGPKGYRVIWEKLLKAKFGKYYTQVNMAWFWTRVAKRTQKLGYFNGGFQTLINKTGEFLANKGVKILLDTKVEKIINKDGCFTVNGTFFDKVLLTIPAPSTEKLIGKNEISWPKIDYLWGQTLILELNRKLISGYWMNILENNWPFLVAVEHTNMVSKVNYGKKTIIYLGNYLESDDSRLGMSDDELLKTYLPYLKKINKNFKKQWISRVFRFKEPFAQPVFPVNYSLILPDYKAKSKNLYVANMSMVYPFDRGTNYAVKMGKEVAKQMLLDL
jgi:protoporphyrinogen oxidase